MVTKIHYSNEFPNSLLRFEKSKSIDVLSVYRLFMYIIKIYKIIPYIHKLFKVRDKKSCSCNVQRFRS